MQFTILIINHGWFYGISLALFRSTRLMTHSKSVATGIIFEVNLRAVSPNTSRTIFCNLEADTIGRVCIRY